MTPDALRAGLDRLLDASVFILLRPRRLRPPRGRLRPGWSRSGPGWPRVPRYGV